MAKRKNTYVVGKDAVWVEGLAEVQRGFGRVSKDLAKETRKGFKRAAEHVVGIAQQRMPFRTGEAARSLKAKGTNAGAAIGFPAGGAGSADQAGGYYPWLDFGGSTGRGHQPGKAWSGAIRHGPFKGGRFLYPAIADSTEYLKDQAGDIVEQAFKSEHFEVVGG